MELFLILVRKSFFTRSKRRIFLPASKRNALADETKRQMLREETQEMKTREPVNDETAALIGKAYVVCSQYPEIFGNVKMSKFCGMFVDVIEEDEDEREARMRAVAPEIYGLLHLLLSYVYEANGLATSPQYRAKTKRDIEQVEALLARIDGEGPEDE